MVAIYLLPCCQRWISYGRFIPGDDCMKRPETLCPLCFKRVTLHQHMGKYVEEHLNNVLHVHKYVLPEIENETELLW